MKNETILNLSSARLLGAYSCDAYGANTYSSTCTTAVQQDTTGGSLVETGYNILLPLALAVALIIAATILLFKRLHRQKSKANQ